MKIIIKNGSLTFQEKGRTTTNYTEADLTEAKYWSIGDVGDAAPSSQSGTGSGLKCMKFTLQTGDEITFTTGTENSTSAKPYGIADSSNVLTEVGTSKGQVTNKHIVASGTTYVYINYLSNLTFAASVLS